MWAIRFTLESRDDASVKLIGSLYEIYAYGNMRIGAGHRALVAGKMVVFLNSNNIVGWIGVANCAWLLNKNTLFGESQYTVEVLYAQVKLLHDEIKAAGDCMDFTKVSDI